jgi:hypothetical protein
MSFLLSSSFINLGTFPILSLEQTDVHLVPSFTRPANNSRRDPERLRITVAVDALDFTHRSVFK